MDTSSVLSKVIASAIKRLTTAVVEDTIEVALFVGTLVRPWLFGQDEPLWTGLAEGVWALSILLGYQIIRAICNVWKENSEPVTTEVESVLYTAQNVKEKRLVVSKSDKYFKPKLLSIGVFSIVLLFFAAFSISTLARGHMVPPIALAPTEVSMSCQMSGLPIHIPPSGVAHLKVINRHQYGNTRNSMDDIVNGDPQKEKLWPDQRIVDSAGINPGSSTYQCSVKNHATANLTDISLDFSAHFFDDSANVLTERVLISPLDGNSEFTFFVVNECPVNVELDAPSNALVQVLGEPKGRAIPLIWPKRLPIEQMLILGFSKVIWTGNSCG